MSYSLGSFPITSGEQLVIDVTNKVTVPTASGNPVKGVMLVNASGFFINVIAGGGQPYTIPPGITDFVPFASSQPTLNIQVGTDNHSLNIQSPEIQGNVYEENDNPPSSLPIANPAFQTSAGGASAGGSIVNQQIFTIPAGSFIRTNIFPVTQFTELLFLLQPFSVAILTYQIDWWLDAAGTIPGPQSTFIRSNGQSKDYFVIPCIAPYFTLTIGQVGGPLTQNRVSIIGLVSTIDQKLLIPSSTVIDIQNETLAASGNNVHAPTIAAPGKYHLWAICGQSTILSVQAWNGSAFDYVVQQTNPANADYNIDFIAPINEWIVIIVNGTAIATTDYIGVIGPD